MPSPDDVVTFCHAAEENDEGDATRTIGTEIIQITTSAPRPDTIGMPQIPNRTSGKAEYGGGLSFTLATTDDPSIYETKTSIPASKSGLGLLTTSEKDILPIVTQLTKVPSPSTVTVPSI